MFGLADSFEDFADIRILQTASLYCFRFYCDYVVPLCLGGGQIMICVRMHLVIIPA
ncbi:MAG: hypothetical protein ACLTJG_12700 [[Clostridium] innocuum]